METSVVNSLPSSKTTTSQEGTTLWKRWKRLTPSWPKTTLRPPVRKELLSERDGNFEKTFSNQISSIFCQEGTTLWKRWKLLTETATSKSPLKLSGRNYSLKEMETKNRGLSVVTNTSHSQEGTTLWKRWKQLKTTLLKLTMLSHVRKELLSERDGNHLQNFRTPHKQICTSGRNYSLKEMETSLISTATLMSPLNRQEGTTLWKRWKLTNNIFLLTWPNSMSGRNYSLKEMETHKDFPVNGTDFHKKSGRNYSLKEMETDYQMFFT